MFAGAGVEWCDAGVAGELGVCVEAFDRADLAEQLGGAEGAAAGQLRAAPARFRWCACCSSRSSSRIVRVRRAAAAEQLACDPHLHRLLAAGEPACDPVEPDRPVERTQRAPRVSGRARAGASAAAAALVGARRRGRRGDRPAASAPAAAPHQAAGDPGRGSRSAALATASASIESDLPRIRLARRCGAISFGGTRTSRSPAVDQRPLEPAGELPAVLNSPQPLLAERHRPARPAPGPRPTVCSATGRPTSSTATAVSECLCTSTPTTIIQIASS